LHRKRKQSPRKISPNVVPGAYSKTSRQSDRFNLPPYAYFPDCKRKNWSTFIRRDSRNRRVARSIWVNPVVRFALIAIFISSSILPASAKKKATHAPTPRKAEIEAATRLQVFLDRANFSPGKIDGHYNDLTRRALALYRESRGEQSQTP